MIDTPLKGSELIAEVNELKGVKTHTRIVGFRTTKSCENAKQIMSVQPIYYSVDEKICKQKLIKLTPGLLEEIPSYGPECAAVPVQSATTAKPTDSVQQQGVSEEFTEITFLAVWFIFGMLLCQSYSCLRGFCEDRRKRIDRKKVELK